MEKIILIEDDSITHAIVKHSLNSEYEIIACTTIAEAKKLIASDLPITAFIVDRYLPDGDGISLCSFIRQTPHRAECPIIFVSSAQSETDKVGAFYAGADDYVTKPFSPLELKARVWVRLRQNKQRLAAGNIQFDLNSHRAFIYDHATLKSNEINLTRIEYLILLTLIKSIDQVFSREHLLEKIWGSQTHVSDRVIDSHISHLRKKISASNLKLESLRKEGYRLSIDLQAAKNHAA